MGQGIAFLYFGSSLNLRLDKYLFSHYFNRISRMWVLLGHSFTAPSQQRTVVVERAEQWMKRVCGISGNKALIQRNKHFYFFLQNVKRFLSSKAPINTPTSLHNPAGRPHVAVFCVDTDKDKQTSCSLYIQNRLIHQCSPAAKFLAYTPTLYVVSLYVLEATSPPPKGWQPGMPPTLEAMLTLQLSNNSLTEFLYF